MAQLNPEIRSGKYSRFRRKYFPLLWFIAAADEDILLLCPAVDQDKQAGIGMAILCTSIAACISSYYAIQSLFGTWYTALPLAIFWGLIILNLDRFMVVSLRKPRKKTPVMDAVVILPRILLALFIALLISKPLEVRIFFNQIDSAEISFKEGQESRALSTRTARIEVARKELAATGTQLDSVRVASRNPELDPVYHQTRLLYEASRVTVGQADQRLARLRSLLASLPADDDRIPAFKVEMSGARRRSSEAHAVCNDLEKRLQRRGVAYGQEQSIVMRDIQNRDSVQSQSYEAQKALLARKADTLGMKMSIASKDILGQLRILDNLKKDDSSIAAADWLITSLFFLLELAPLLIKIGSARGKYDMIVSLAEQQALDDEGAAIEESKHERIIREEAAVRTNGQAAEIDQELREQVKSEILHAQASLAKEIVAAWEEREKKELERDPSAYLQGKITTSNQL